MRRDLRIFAPWTERLASPPSGCAEIAARVAALMTYGMTSPVGAGEAQALDALDAFSRDAVPDAVREWIQDLRAAIAEGRLAAQELSDRLESLAHRATTLAREMDFALLFDPATRPFHIHRKRVGTGKSVLVR